ncbi:MAG TPA: VOC family protein [Nocardioides sp.]|uniref:VOC family protein n=1 Tax=Nocardioides sp. TaxID=35761 RepID=UPI002CDF2EEE|nr:VOC family protein [Nocardioides sp.]HTW14634.1 VOC family protein [Nocardioides sp.]
MPALATYQDLCVDAVDPLLAGRFWAGVLGREVRERGDGLVQLTGRTPRHTVWVNPVPEPVTVKQRVHLDLHAASVDDVLALGATALDLDSRRWQVLRDPEGGELCVFEREQVPDERLYEIVVDSVDPERTARWWGGVLGARVDGEEGGAWSVEDIDGAPFAYLVFAPVPEPKTVKNRIHWDVATSDLDALVAAGASVVRRRDPEIRWTVLADPEGNEFCVFTD